MEHPYKEYENSKTWKLTPKEYVIGYICKGLSKQATKESD